MVVAFLDLLGVRARWHEGGRESAEAAFGRLESLVAETLSRLAPKSLRDGAIETDSAAIVFGATEDALAFIRDLFTDAFAASGRARDERLWIRGTVTALHGRGALRRSEHLAQHGKVRVFRLEGSLLDAIAVEKSGFKGMRIVVEEKLLTQAVRDRFAVKAGSRDFVPFRSLTNSVYPRRIADVYQDFLWMARSQEVEWRKLKRAMSNRLRWSAQDSEEFVQAASTQVVFNETAAIFRSLEAPRRRGRAGAGAKPPRRDAAPPPARSSADPPRAGASRSPAGGDGRASPPSSTRPGPSPPASARCLG
jgi:hypothetical protein